MHHNNLLGFIWKQISDVIFFFLKKKQYDSHTKLRLSFLTLQLLKTISAKHMKLQTVRNPHPMAREEQCELPKKLSTNWLMSTALTPMYIN